MNQLNAGVAVVNITPPVGVDMTGFGRSSPAVGIHDELYARALVLSNEDTTLALITSDLLALDFDIIQRLREQIQEQWQIPPEQVMINSSHTHSGPATITTPLGKLEPNYIEVLIKKMVGAVQMAYQKQEPAHMDWGRQQVQVGINRREKRDDGKMVLGVNPEGPVADYVDVLRVGSAASGQPMGILFSHAAHPVAVGGLQFSADYPGYAVRVIEQIEPGIAMFAQGCCGNINAYPETFPA